MHRIGRMFATAVALTASVTAVHAQTTPPTSGGAGTMSGSGMGTQDTTAHGTMRGGHMGARGMRSGASDTALVAQLDTVNTAAKAGLTNLPAAAAASLVESIRTKLAGSRNASLRSIATDLAALHRELGMSTVNGERIGAILRRVGPKVTRVAASQSGAVASMLREIGTELTTSGRQLEGGTH